MGLISCIVVLDLMSLIMQINPDNEGVRRQERFGQYGSTNPLANGKAPYISRAPATSTVANA